MSHHKPSPHVSYRNTPHHIPWHHITSHDITLHCITSHHKPSPHVSYRNTPHHIPWHHIASPHTTSHCITATLSNPTLSLHLPSPTYDRTPFVHYKTWHDNIMRLTLTNLDVTRHDVAWCDTAHPTWLQVNSYLTLHCFTRSERHDDLDARSGEREHRAGTLAGRTRSRRLGHRQR